MLTLSLTAILVFVFVLYVRAIKKASEMHVDINLLKSELEQMGSVQDVKENIYTMPTVELIERLRGLPKAK